MAFTMVRGGGRAGRRSVCRRLARDSPLLMAVVLPLLLLLLESSPLPSTREQMAETRRASWKHNGGKRGVILCVSQHPCYAEQKVSRCDFITACLGETQEIFLHLSVADRGSPAHRDLFACAVLVPS